MALVNMMDLLHAARRGRYAVGAFEFWSLESAQAVVKAAEEQGMPVILQAGPFECDYAGIEELAAIARMVEAKANTPVALHLDHGESFERAQAAVEAGFTSVMIDASHQDFAANVEATRRVSDLAHAHGISVEGELGRLEGAETGHTVEEAEACQTDPAQALEYVRQTGVDCLAVAIGSVHGFYNYPPKLNIERLDQIVAKVDMPIVLHGGSGIPPEEIRASISHGVSKINICTEFLAAMGRQYIATQQAAGFKYSIPALFGPSKEAGCALAKEKIELFQNR